MAKQSSNDDCQPMSFAGPDAEGLLLAARRLAQFESNYQRSGKPAQDKIRVSSLENLATDGLITDEQGSGGDEADPQSNVVALPTKGE